MYIKEVLVTSLSVVGKPYSRLNALNLQELTIKSYTTKNQFLQSHYHFVYKLLYLLYLIRYNSLIF